METRTIVKKVTKSIDLKFGAVDDINKIKNDILSAWKSHVSKRDSWGAESSKILQAIGKHEANGVQLKKEVDSFDKQLLDLSSKLTKLRNQADQLGLDLPQELGLLDGVSVNSWNNKFVDTREIVDKFQTSK
jgi:hypothetical protein